MASFTISTRVAIQSGSSPTVGSCPSSNQRAMAIPNMGPLLYGSLTNPAAVTAAKALARVVSASDLLEKLQPRNGHFPLHHPSPVSAGMAQNFPSQEEERSPYAARIEALIIQDFSNGNFTLWDYSFEEIDRKDEILRLAAQLNDAKFDLVETIKQIFHLFTLGSLRRHLSTLEADIIRSVCGWSIELGMSYEDRKRLALLLGEKNIFHTETDLTMLRLNAEDFNQALMTLKKNKKPLFL